MDAAACVFITVAVNRTPSGAHGRHWECTARRTVEFHGVCIFDATAVPFNMYGNRTEKKVKSSALDKQVTLNAVTRVWASLWCV